ncbi:MAG: hypothetical protein ACKVOR_12815 [Flavobacteriales bacterium]
MKKILIVMMTCAALVACNNTAQNTTDPAAAQPTQQAALNTDPIPYYQGKGNKTLCSLSMNMNVKGGYEVTFIAGDDTWTGTFQKSSLYADGKAIVKSNEVLLTGTLEGADAGEATTISIFGEPCTDDEGKLHGSRFVVNKGNTDLRFNGCGDYIE